MTFNALNWYWIVGDVGQMVFSSASAAYVRQDSEAYTAWVDCGGVATRIANEDELSEVLSRLAPGVIIPSATGLISHANLSQMKKALGGVSVQLTDQVIQFSTDPVSMAFVNGKALRIQLPNPPATVNWQVGPTSFVAITSEDFITAAAHVADFIQSTFDALPGLFEKIENGEITTTAEIDAVFDAM
jgi:hypothetical protein